MSVKNENAFWEKLLDRSLSKRAEADHLGIVATTDVPCVSGAIETRIQGRLMGQGAFTSVRALTDVGREALTLTLPVEAGTRVAFEANAGSLLAYDDAPDPGGMGTVVAVKSASGPVTSHGERVFVRWDDGVLRAIAAEHLRPAVGTRRTATSPHRIRVASLGDLTDFLKLGEDTLVHKATKDLWSVKRDGSDYVIERLFDESGGPVKV